MVTFRLTWLEEEEDGPDSLFEDVEGIGSRVAVVVGGKAVRSINIFRIGSTIRCVEVGGAIVAQGPESLKCLISGAIWTAPESVKLMDGAAEFTKAAIMKVVAGHCAMKLRIQEISVHITPNQSTASDAVATKYWLQNEANF